MWVRRYKIEDARWMGDGRGVGERESGGGGTGRMMGREDYLRMVW
jgi:hypothetical protein